MKPPRQLELIPAEKPKRDRLLLRQGSKYWQARFWAAGAWQQRSTFTVDRMVAAAVLACWKKQFQRRGKPNRGAVFADAA